MTEKKSGESALASLLKLEEMLMKEALVWYDKDKSKTADMISEFEVLISAIKSLLKSDDYITCVLIIDKRDLTSVELKKCFHPSESVKKDEIERRKKEAVALWMNVVLTISNIVTDGQQQKEKEIKKK